LLVVVVVAAPQSLADRRVRDTHMTRPLAKQWDVAGGTFSSAAEQMMRTHNATQAILVTLLWPRDRLHQGLARKQLPVV
jgi:adenylate kinase